MANEKSLEKGNATSDLVFSADEETAVANDYGIDAVFLAKTRVINKALREIGFGKYQWQLFFSSGFGWAADNLWLQGNAILLPFISYEFFDEAGANHVKLATLALYAGLIVGATFWGFSADVVGRRFAFNSTLFIGGIFGIIAGASPNFAAYGVFIALLGFGVGGNLPIDGALFLEFVPESHQYLLTLLSVFWAIGQVIASLISWAFLANYSCPLEDYYTPRCNTSNNQGWRYSLYTLGALCTVLALLRCYVLPMQESPKFLISIGKDEAAVEVIHKVAKINGKVSSLTVEELRGTAADMAGVKNEQELNTKYSTIELLKKSGEIFKGDNVKRLFATRKLAWNTSLVIIIYGALGLAYPLFNAFLGSYLTARNAQIGVTSVSATYATYTYQAACGIPGSVIAAVLVLGRFGGRRTAMSFFTILSWVFLEPRPIMTSSGIFLFALTAVRTSPGINGLTSVAAFAENAFYGILYAYAPEIFPSQSRGTGDALASAASRVTGIFAPIIAVYGNPNPNAPVYASAAIFIFSGLLMLCLTIEPAKMKGGAL